MAFIPVLACVQARLQFQEPSGIVAQNVFYLATASAPTETDLSEIGGVFDDWLTESLQDVYTPNWTATGVALRAMNEAEGIETFYDTAFPKPGLADSSANPNQVSYTVTWNTGLVGRSARGRSYGVGVPFSYVLNQVRLTDAGQAQLQGRWANLITIAEAAGHALQVVSFVEGGVPRTEGRKLPVVASNVRFPLATQRRRLS